MAGLFVQFRIFISFCIDADIEFEEFVDWVGFNGFLVTPELVGNNQHAKLLAPVSQVIDPDGLVAQFRVDVAESIGDNSGAQMPNGEGFCDVGAGHVQGDILPVTDVLLAIVSLFRNNSPKDVVGNGRLVQEEVDIGTGSYDFFKASGIDFFGNFASDGLRGLTLYLC